MYMILYCIYILKGEALLTIGYAKFIHVTIHSQISFHRKCKNIEENLFQWEILKSLIVYILENTNKLKWKL
jgi:hypothetical protein